MIIARHISGKIGKIRGYIRTFLLVIYLIIPWISWNNRPAVLFDISARKFYFPGIVLWPQEFYFLLLLVILLGLSLFLFTSLFGRIWCGWACPQTIYTEFFDFIGRLILPKKFGKRSESIYHKIFIHFIWIITSVFITFHFIGYFAGTKYMIYALKDDGFLLFRNNIWPYFFVIISALFYLDLGIFREHFCIYVCPYARFQSVMLDRDSIVIGYDSHRGEPRRRIGKNIIAAGTQTSHEKYGDCTACNMCVLVCPTGIDIREGLQVSCINCGHCVDACEKEMGKHDKLTLIGYSSLNYYEDRIPIKFFRTRTAVYSLILSLVGILFASLLMFRSTVNLSLQRDRTIQPLIASGIVQNYYELQIVNMGETEATYWIETKHLDKNKTEFDSFEQLIGENPVIVPANQIKTLRLILRGSLNNNHDHTKLIDIEVHVTDKNNSSNYTIKKSYFTIPQQSI